MAGASRTPVLSLILGYGPMLVFPVLAVAAWLLPPLQALLVIEAGQLWGAALLTFLAGVRRGLSFFTDGGPRPAQIAMMFWLFLLGLFAFLAPASFAYGVLVIGFGSIGLLDPPAARRGEAPEFFARLRPPQMAIAVAGLIGLWVWVLR